MPVNMLAKPGQKSKIELRIKTHNPMELIFKCCTQKPVDLKILERLLYNSECVDARLHFVAANHCSVASRPTALHIAAENGQKKAVELLLSHGAAINADGGCVNASCRRNQASPCVRNGWRPLHLAADKGHDEVVKLLLDKGADHLLKTRQDFVFILLIGLHSSLIFPFNCVNHLQRHSPLLCDSFLSTVLDCCLQIWGLQMLP